jgi:hypothetical protein
MTEQPLFDGIEPSPRRMRERQPETSRDAFSLVKLREEQDRVWGMVAAAGARGMTADEVEAQRGAGGHQRFAELRRLGMIRRSGQKRRTRAGRYAYVYVA